MIYVIAISELHPGCREKFIAAAKENIPNVRAEEGCLLYELNGNFASGLSAQIPLNDDTVVFIEGWASMVHLKKHLESAHMADFRTKVSGMRKASTMRVVTPVA